VTDITATLRNAVRFRYPWWPKGAYVLFAAAYGDTKGRWLDGTEMHTSMVVEELSDDTFKTLNSTYKVESWAPLSEEPQ
jgi:hypothetical protein